MTDSAPVLNLIRRYVEESAKFAVQLRRELQADDLLSAVNAQRIPRQGMLSGGTLYRFHGVGCVIEHDELDLDFDFGPDGRCGGFDAWRLRRFAEQFPQFEQQCSMEAIEQALADLAKQGTIVQPQAPPSPHLFYLATDW